TICTNQRMHLFGEIVDGRMRLNEFGEIVVAEWLKTPTIRAEIELDEWVVMPNHFHAIVCIRRGDRPVAPTVAPPPRPVARPGAANHAAHGPRPKSIGAMIAGFKSGVTTCINTKRGSPGAKVWQRGYYEHIIRDNESMGRIREYITMNPMKWGSDRENNQRQAETPGRSSFRVAEEAAPWET
ncbi:MAG TPA: transposase, partial [Candidatus Ozemobacteraceae bacterium]|nr:transposase [Candidatus Ozemobacteraceae bacterium]